MENKYYDKTNKKSIDVNFIPIPNRTAYDSNRITRVSGYIPLKERISNFVKAGENLEEYRNYTYAYADDDEIVSNKEESLLEQINNLNIDSDRIEQKIELLNQRLEKEQLRNKKMEEARQKRFEEYERSLADEKTQETENAPRKETI